MTDFIILVILVIYFGWGSFLVIEDFSNKTWKAPMYVINFREGRDRLLSCLIALIKIILWPIAYLFKLL
jgi:hypothetical protein